MTLETQLKSRKTKTIGLSELKKMVCVATSDPGASDVMLFDDIAEMVSAGLLIPIKSSGTNGNKQYPLYLKYRINHAEDYSEALTEIAFLHPAMTKNGYLSNHPEQYIKYVKQLKKLDSCLFRGRPRVAVSKKERSFELFGEEKQLEDAGFCGLLNHLGLTSEVLNYYETPEYCFNDYISKRKSRLALLILENKDIWFNLRRRMYEDSADELFGVCLDGVVYGCGNRVSETGALEAYTRFMNAEKVEYLYWGDIDRAGLGIFQNLVKSNPKLNINLFVPAYEEMLRLSVDREIPDSDDRREFTGDFEEIYGMFSGAQKDRLMTLIENNKRLPQEIITYETLLRVMR